MPILLFLHGRGSRRTDIYYPRDVMCIEWVIGM
ncbi:hypothetical protein CORC01_03064 [Colletotrichum orchidophilum]|uniref:Uncharacterized protein n=1 Tax=Colletotrichum orchidophilum TaxID=1209926 RepID=A0A1G4BJH7_9PEZI|nr:uncharacterized protein CORC01_03064 [Colletotrichum orchidophilum]OHF01574.1 hypothetical protein CORC01_03064 [Colletotrichum orchidophilum]